ncbi:MAG: DNA polymerase IV [Planctomycetes bacterium]|nr:DNA polymerase IV [Planctomycetota bacterium]
MILHVDMDAFYASIEERDRPELAGRPLIVGGTPQGRGVVAAANYAVRKFGVHSAMPTSKALRLCPQAIVLPVRMEHYAAVSRQIRSIFHRYTPLVEPLSLDEAFLDVAGSEGLFGPAVEMAQTIKRDIRDETGLVASVGVAPNKFLAKLASDLEKPDGLVIVEPQRVQEFLDPLPVGRLWGVGRVAGRILDELGIQTIGQLRGCRVAALHERFGKTGAHLWQLAHGLDERTVVPDRDAKSVSHETTFAVDIADAEALRAWLLELVEQVGRRLRRSGRRGRTVNLKVRFSDFRTIVRSQSLPDATASTERLWKAAAELFSKLPPGHLPVRLLGMGVSGISRAGFVQRRLFDETGPQQTGLDDATDRIRDRFGAAALLRGSNLRFGARHAPLPRPESDENE